MQSRNCGGLDMTCDAAVLVDDVDALGGGLCWFLYSIAEAVDLNGAGVIAQTYGATITNSAMFILDEFAPECLYALCDLLDTHSPPGFFFGFEPHNDQSLGWYRDAPVAI